MADSSMPGGLAEFLKRLRTASLRSRAGLRSAPRRGLDPLYHATRDQRRLATRAERQVIKAEARRIWEYLKLAQLPGSFGAEDSQIMPGAGIGLADQPLQAIGHSPSPLRIFQQPLGARRVATPAEAAEIHQQARRIWESRRKIESPMTQEKRSSPLGLTWSAGIGLADDGDSWRDDADLPE